MKEFYAPGHRTCAGCGPAVAVRHILDAFGKNTIITNSTGCIEVTGSPYPQTSWRLPYLHANFENAPSIACGVVEALRQQGKEDVKVLSLGGDGGTVDIGFGALSGAFERRHNFTYICYDNESYANTGVQCSGSTPFAAWSSTSPVGKVKQGKDRWKKNTAFIMAMHGADYVATASIADPDDLKKKIKKGLEYDGSKYIHVLTPCPIGWKFDSQKTIEYARLAVNSGMWALFEIDQGEFRITEKPKDLGNIGEYIKGQGRFKHVTASQLKEMQSHVKKSWKELEKLEKSGLNLKTML
ncbi:MAG: pyruvate synthase subunit beta [Candidatus Diapherotrites archaeon]|nr:pyruvate synthase subunit beta [Candidatus Diapherotrites archaeon]